MQGSSLQVTVDGSAIHCSGIDVLGCCALAAACEARGQWKLALASCRRSVEQGRSAPSKSMTRSAQLASGTFESSRSLRPLLLYTASHSKRILGLTSPAQVWGRTRPWQERGLQLAAPPTFGRQGRVAGKKIQALEVNAEGC